jgi:hypothetical protein
MPLVMHAPGAVTLSVRYVHKRKSDGAYFYYRRIPVELKRHYPDAGPFIRKSLGTKDPTRAVARAIEHTNRDDAFWSRLRANGRCERRALISPHAQSESNPREILSTLLGGATHSQNVIKGGNSGPLLSEITEDYLRHHAKGSTPTFIKVTRLGMGAVLTSVGDLGLGDYTRDHARQCRQHLLSAGNRTTTISRQIPP